MIVQNVCPIKTEKAKPANHLQTAVINPVRTINTVYLKAALITVRNVYQTKVEKEKPVSLRQQIVVTNRVILHLS